MECGLVENTENPAGHQPKPTDPKEFPQDTISSFDQDFEYFTPEPLLGKTETEYRAVGDGKGSLLPARGTSSL